MYSAVVNSPETELSAEINAVITTISVLDTSKLAAAPGLLTIGSDDTAETVRYEGISGNDLTGCTRGFEGTAKAWAVGAKAARYFAAYDHNTFRTNIEDVYALASAAETPAGAQTKVDTLAGLGNTKTVKQLDDALIMHLVETATLTTKGHTQLSSSVTSASEVEAATPKAVKTAMDRADAAFQSGANVKNDVVDVINAKGGSASTSDDWSTLVAKLGQLSSGIQVVTGTTTTNLSATISNLAIKPFAIVLFGDVTSKSHSSGTALARGSVIAYKNDTSFIAPDYLLAEGGLSGIMQFSSVVFGINSINYTLTIGVNTSTGAPRKYYIFGT
jgi:hypothetical protein